MSSFIERLRDRPVDMQKLDSRTPPLPSRSATTFSQRHKDPNSPIDRLSLTQQCIYERPLPGDSYITAHLTRLQLGYYDSPEIHNDRIDNVCFMAVNFIFHPADTRHRFTRAKIKLSLSLKDDAGNGPLAMVAPLGRLAAGRPRANSKPGMRERPKFLRFAPHIIYGSLSPETLDWNFNLAGSLGVTQGPANASLQPSGGVKSSYKIYKSMKIQGSLRTLENWTDHEDDVDDGELVWTLEENELQKSGLPREFTFVALLMKGHPSNNVAFNIDIEPVVGSWYGTYPKWWLHRVWYQPLHKQPVSLSRQLGQSFEPSTKDEGFNFANLMGCFDDFVTLPGTTYTTSDQLQTPDQGAAATAAASPQKKQPASKPEQPISASPAPLLSNDINLRIFLEGNAKNAIEAPLNAIPRPQSSRSLLLIQSTSPLPRVTPAKSTQRQRPSSGSYSISPPLESSRAVTRQRPVSAIYESELPSSMAKTKHHLRDEVPGHNQKSATKDATVAKTRSPLPFEITLGSIRSSRSLRHRRSRDGLTTEYSTRDTPPRAAQKPESQLKPTQQPSNTLSPWSNGIVNRSASVTIGRRPASISSSSPSPPSSETNLQISSPPTFMTAPSPPPTKTTSSHPKRMSYAPKPDAILATPSAAALESARFSTASTLTNDRGNATSPITSAPAPRFPPSSFPAYLRNSTSDSANNNNTNNAACPLSSDLRIPTTMKSIPPPSPPFSPTFDVASPNDVDGIVQREVNTFFKTHPEISNPRSNGRGGINGDVVGRSYAGTAGQRDHGGWAVYQ